MVRGFEEPTTKTVDENFAAGSSNSGTSNNDNNDAGNFECNICWDSPQDPIVTLCGHLFCWRCLYRWLHYHSNSQECPVCKALVEERKLVPLYGRSNSSSDPRTRPIPGLEIPNRPTGQRPETSPPLHSTEVEQRYFPTIGFGLLGGFMPMASARFGNVTMAAGFSGLFPAYMSFQFNGSRAHPHGFHNGFPQAGYMHGAHPGPGHGHGYQNHPQDMSQRQDILLKNMIFIIGILLLLSSIFI